MTIGGALRTKLVGTDTVSAIIGSRMYHMQAPQVIVSAPDDADDLDHITYQRISTTPFPAMTGTEPLTTERIQIDCMSRNGSQAMRLAAAVRGALDGFDGDISEFARVVIMLEDSGDLPVDLTPGSEQAWNRVSMDFFVSYDDPAVLLTPTGA